MSTAARRPLAGSLPYQPGIDGLRALSVIAVIAYHLEATWAVGGYLGVEVFFVVSGYLITALLLRERDATGTVSLRGFWIRRARRLLPAVVVLIGAVCLWGALVLPVGDLRQFRGDAVASLLYVQNWHAIVADQPYFALFGRPSPFRHLWSLAIEEQFYLVWPLLLPALLRLGRRFATVAIAVGTVASIALMASVADIAAIERAYYGTDARAFGILAGALLAFAWRPLQAPGHLAGRRSSLLDLAGVAALATLGWQLATRSEFDPWTFPWGLATVDAATVVLIAAVTAPATILSRVLGVSLLGAVGRRSYSLYLWHWPVIACTQLGDVTWEGTELLAARLALTAGLAELSYRFVEQPVRSGAAGLWLRRARTQQWLPLGATGAIGAVVAIGLVAAAPRNEPVPLLSVAADLPTAVRFDPDPTTTTTTTAPIAVVAAPTTTVSATTVPPRPIPDVTLIGESVTLGAAPRLLEYWDRRVQIDAVEGRSFLDSVELIEALAGVGRLTPTVIVHIGNNGVAPPGALDRVVAAVGPERRLVLVNVRVPRRWQEQVNDAIAATVATHSHVYLADWHALSGTEEGLLISDGVHLSHQGQIRYRDLLIAFSP